MYTYIEEFAWALPTAFIEPLSQCIFNKGDIIYSNQSGYRPWGKMLPETKYIQIRKSDYIPLEGNSESGKRRDVFNNNWNNAVSFNICHAGNDTEENIQTTSGRLFTFLWKNDKAIFGHDNEPVVPEQPTKIKMKNIDCDLLVNAVAMSDKRGIVIAFPYALLNTTLVNKVSLIKSVLLAKFNDTIETTLGLEQLGLDKSLYIPTTSIKCFIVNTENIEYVKQMLTKLLDTSKKKNIKTKTGKLVESKFKLERHCFIIPMM